MLHNNIPNFSMNYSSNQSSIINYLVNVISRDLGPYTTKTKNLQLSPENRSKVFIG